MTTYHDSAERQELLNVLWAAKRPVLIKQKKRPAAYIYFIQMGEAGPIKIGWAVNPQTRLDALQTASPYELRLLVAVAGSMREEKMLHAIFSDYRLRGEWFNPAPDVMNEIARLIEREKAERKAYPLELPGLKESQVAADEMSAFDGSQLLAFILDQEGPIDVTPQMLLEVVRKASKGLESKIERAILLYMLHEILPDYSRNWPERSAALAERLNGAKVTAEEIGERCGVARTTVLRRLRKFANFAALYMHEAIAQRLNVTRRPQRRFESYA